MGKIIFKLEVRQWLLIFSGLVLAGLLFSKAPIAQLNHYHNFADIRFFGIPNAQNVFSNLIFIIAGYYAAVSLSFEKFNRRDRLFLITFVFGVFFTGFGSMYYHLHPNTNTLFWDRLPMTIGFASFTYWLLSRSALKKFNETNLEMVLFWGYLFAALGTTVYWSYSETINQGDLRPYLFIQYFSIVSALIVVIMYKTESYPRFGCFLLFLFYVLAKFTEAFDSVIYAATFQVTSGHALKHLIAGIGCLLFLHYLKIWSQTSNHVKD